VGAALRRPRSGGYAAGEATYADLAARYADVPHVHVLPTPHRVHVNWGGFSMVEATLRCLRYARGHLTGRALDFHKVTHLSSTAYPLVSNAEIRDTLASYPVDANLLEVRMKRSEPGPDSWHYFVECDDKVHRIYRMPPPSGPDVALYMSSQWWTIGRDFAHYMV